LKLFKHVYFWRENSNVIIPNLTYLYIPRVAIDAAGLYCVVHLLRKTTCLQRVFVAWRVITKQNLLRP
jgi:hypothetical protein